MLPPGRGPHPRHTERFALELIESRGKLRAAYANCPSHFRYDWGDGDHSRWLDVSEPGPAHLQGALFTGWGGP